MSKEIYISSTPHETRLAIVENDALTEIYYERENEYTLAGSIYNGRVTRVLPGMQSSFVDIGLERDAFLYITDFMEEAGDTADFEANANGGDSRRRESSSGNRDRGPRRDRDRGDRDRGDREQQPRPAAEPTDADLFASAVSGLDPARPVTDQERGDRGRRGGRDRNRRDRNNDSSRNQNDRNQDVPKAEQPEPILAAPPAVEFTSDLGEGAPGADGSRRWRGRRGRRGNRGGERPATDSTVAASLASPIEETAPIYESYAADEAQNSFDMDGVAATQVADAARAESSPAAERHGRGGRNRRGRGGREDRGQQVTEQARNARDFAPSASLYKGEGNEESHAEAPVYGQAEESSAPLEPMILPGESLSKYRPGGAEAFAHQAAPAVESAPAVAFVAQGWDGGLVLPGETIRPRGPQTGAGHEARGPRQEDRREMRGGERDRGGRERDGRDGRHGKGDRGPRPDRNAELNPDRRPEDSDMQQPVTAAAAETPTYLNDPDHVPASHLITPLNSTFVAPPPMPMASAEAAVEDFEPVVHTTDGSTGPVEDTVETVAEPAKAEPETEYEPKEGFASYKVDPAPPSEYRQNAPVMEESQDVPRVVEDSTEADSSAALRNDNTESVPADNQESASAHNQVEAPQFTSIDASGEMFSEPAVSELPQTEQSQPASPIVHETAVFEAAHQPAGFAPGDGMLEEEMLDEDEDGDLSPALSSLHAHGQDHEEHDSHEQETLEGAADLGVMLREMSIDQITRSEPATDEDDDLEEDDFLEEDQDFDPEEHSADDLDESEESDEPLDDLEHSEYGSGFEGERTEQAEDSLEQGAAAGEAREPRREGRGRRDGRRGDRNRRPGGNDRERSATSTGSSDSPQEERASPERERHSNGGGRRDGRGGRQSMQTTNLPAISDLLKPGQEILCQIAKEPIAKKGARITSHIALPGRFLVFMPTVNHTGVSRKIESDGERRRLKEILLSEKGEASGGFIVRTAASGASEEELRSDLRFLLNLWTDIKTRSEASKSPALIYHDLNLVERVLRDQVTDNFSAIWVDTELQYESVLRFLQRFQPSLIRRVKLYTKETPLFEQFGITEEINKALRSKVWLKSGGSIVINQTEALVAIDINTGKFVGKTARLEDTIVKTNLDAIPEIVRQIRLRDLGGIIIIDFIDMDERKNRNKVMAALEEELKSDRAPSKVLQFNDFGLVAITRKRVKQSLERTLSTTCGVCAGTGMTKSPVTVCNDIYVEMRKMQKHLDRGDVMLRVHPEVVKQLKAPATNWLHEMEEMCGKTILVKSDPSLHPEQFDIH